jgi:pimeloyl-ACP methyl ester carboxylesterase
MTNSDHYYTSTDGLTLHYRTYTASTYTPDAKIAICLPGLTRNERDFTELARWLISDELAGKVHCLSFRGRGRSDHDPQINNYHPETYATDVATFLDHKKIDQAVFIGTSLGGIVTMLLAGRQPQKIRAAILNDIGPDIAPEGIMRIMGYVSDRKSWTSRADAAEAAKLTHGSAFPLAPADFWEKFVQQTCIEKDGIIEPDYDEGIVKALAIERSPLDLWPFFKKLTAPTLSIRGEISDLFTEETQIRMHSQHPDLSTAVIPQTGHAPTLDEAPARSAIAAFLRKR